MPIQVTERALVSDQVYEFVLCFRGPNGNPFGDLIPLKLKVTNGVARPSYRTEVEMNKLAIKLYENKVGKSYDECIRAVEKFNGNEEAVIKYLMKDVQI